MEKITLISPSIENPNPRIASSAESDYFIRTYIASRLYPDYYIGGKVPCSVVRIILYIRSL